MPIDYIVFDAEHSEISDSALNVAIALVHAKGVEVYIKVRLPSREPIQRCLDFGADGVIVPHITSPEEAKLMSSYAKYPPLGDRSLAAERASGYGMQLSPGWWEDQNHETKFFALIEDAEALETVKDIAALPSVDGLFPGAVDLAIRRGRGVDTRSEEALTDLQTIVTAAHAHGKSVMMAAWNPEDQRFAAENGVGDVLISSEYSALIGAFQDDIEAANSIFAGNSTSGA
ncbi:aldolase/citrate lyase family protein (plasmid) [Arthrobacter sp. D3-18]